MASLLSQTSSRKRCRRHFFSRSRRVSYARRGRKPSISISSIPFMGCFQSAAHGTGFLFLLAYFPLFVCRRFRENGRIRVWAKNGFAAMEEFEEDEILSK